jgi:hypothetical protein
MIVLGENDQTKVRTLRDRKRKVFQRGGVDSFIMSVNQYKKIRFNNFKYAINQSINTIQLE